MPKVFNPAEVMVPRPLHGTFYQDVVVTLEWDPLGPGGLIPAWDIEDFKARVFSDQDKLPGEYESAADMIAKGGPAPTVE